MSRIAVALLLGGVATGLLLGPTTARAENDGPTAIASTAAAFAVESFICWAAHKAVKDRDEDQEPLGDFERPGWLVALSGVYVGENFAESEAVSQYEVYVPFPTSLSLDSGRPGVGGHIGYRCHPRFSTEVEIEGATFSGEVSQEQQGVISTVSVAPLMVSVNAKGYLLTGRFQPFALFGVGTLTVEGTQHNKYGPPAMNFSNETMTALRLGGGIDVYATRRIAIDIKADYVLPVAGVDTLEYFTVGAGLMFRF